MERGALYNPPQINLMEKSTLAKKKKQQQTPTKIFKLFYTPAFWSVNENTNIIGTHIYVLKNTF